MKNLEKNRRSLAVRTSAGAIVLSLLASGNAAIAQGTSSADETASVPGDIIVTAQRREQSALDVPLSLTALDESLIRDKQVTALNDLQFVAPGIRSGQQQGSNRLFIRGIGLSSFAAGADSSVAFYVDGVYIGRPTQQLSSFYDIGRVEVLRGPQGALYGRNATGGAVNLISNDPEREASGYLNFTAGNYDFYQGEGAFSMPLSTNGDFRARVAFKVVERDGYGYDFKNQKDINDSSAKSARLTLQYNPDSAVNIKMTGEYTHEDDNNYHTTNFGPYQFGNLALCPRTNGVECQLPGVVDYPNGFGGQGPAEFEIRNSQDGATNLDLFPGKRNRREGFALTLNANFALNDVLDLNSITGWRKFDRYNSSNADGSSSGIGNVDYDENNRQFSQELILNYDGGPFQATAGASYYNEKLDNAVIAPFIQFDNPATPQFDNPYRQDGTLKIDAIAFYLQGTYSVTPALRITAAGRYSSEKRTSTGVFTGLFVPPTILDDSRRWSSFTPKFGIEYDVTEGTMLYASYTKGFKSGTFNVGQDNPAVNPEKIQSYEAGIKSRFLDNSVDLTAAYFHYKYKNLQVNKIIGIATLTTNAAAAKTDGFEIAVNARLTPQFTLSGNFTYLDSTFTDFLSVNPLFPAAGEEDLSGNVLPGSPKYAFVVGAQYALPVGGDGQEIKLNADASYQSRIHFSEFNDDQLSQKGVTKVNASIRYDSGDSWTVSLWGKNITDENTANNKVLGIQLWGFPIYGAIDAPATYGGTIGFKF